MHVLNETPDEADRGHVNAAVQACPVLALTLVE
jgi:ferredoxin